MAYKTFLRKIVKLKDLIRTKQNISIITHVNPDGDAIGSSLAFTLMLKKLGRQVHTITPNDYPEFLKWIPGNNNIQVHEKESFEVEKKIVDSELIICLDFNSVNRMDALANSYFSSKAVKVLIDHHPMPEQFTDIIITDTQVSSTAELLYEVIREIYPETIDKDIATALFTGILTDTGSFNYNASNPNTYNVVGDLLQYNVNRAEISDNVYDNYSADRMRLMGHCLKNRLYVYHEYHAAFIYLTLKDMEHYNYKIGDSEGFVNLPLSIKGIIFTVLFTEREDHIKMSLRSKGRFDVNQFARKNFNGGGHLNAAGGYCNKNLQDTIDTFVLLLDSYKNHLLESVNELSSP